MTQQSTGSWWSVLGAVVVLIAGYLALKYGINPPIPSSLLYAYLGLIAIAIYVYRQAIQFNKTSDSTAMSYILLFIVIVLTNLYLYLANRRAKEET